VRLARAGLFAFYLLLLAELASRAFWWAARDVSPRGSALDFYGAFFHGLASSGVLADPPRSEDARFDVLLLGGSVLDALYQDRGALLAERLRGLSGREVRLLNLAEPAHTLRDSLLKYRLLEAARFDLVIVYDNINDVRLNNAPREHFADDYSHAAWYDELARLARRAGWLPWLTLPVSLEYAAVELGEASGLAAYVPRHLPRAEWRAEGGDLKTLGPFRENLREILALARARGEPVLLATFAWYLPPDYSVERFATGVLGYELRDERGELEDRLAVELWGQPSFVAKGLAAHNQIVRELATGPGVIFVDAELDLPWEARDFHDICHFSPRGELRFSEALLAALQRELARGPAR
jgi:hypothetical protein